MVYPALLSRVRNLMAHGDAREGKWRGKMRKEWVASSLALYVETRSIQSLSADAHSSTASSRLNWHPRRFKWTRPFRWKTKSGFCACAITFQTCSINASDCGMIWVPYAIWNNSPNKFTICICIQLYFFLPKQRKSLHVSIPERLSTGSRYIKWSDLV